GSYLVLPVLGPSNMRDGIGSLTEIGLNSAFGILSSQDGVVRLSVGTLEAIDTRSNTSFRYYETGTPFEYDLVRYLYTKMREVKISE
ncbi:MAG: VacJ family lipoprotein, partial [Deltaproteobacteria bacterium]|nr:VacJ family lipoprotein [Deltaproteobacteria bacterium]